VDYCAIITNKALSTKQIRWHRNAFTM